jgi:hypothetical protein
MEVEASRRALRHRPEPYEVQQARNLRNWLTPDEVTWSVSSFLLETFAN